MGRMSIHKKPDIYSTARGAIHSNVKYKAGLGALHVIQVY